MKTSKLISTKSPSALNSSDANKTLLLITASCSSCVRTKKFFIDNKLPYIEINFYTKPILEKHFKDILSLTENGVYDVISMRSKYLTNNKIDINSLKISELIKLVHEHPSIVKRPILLQYDKSGNPKRLMIGYNSVDIRVFLRPLKDIEFHKSDFTTEDNSKFLEFPDDISPVRTVPKKSKTKSLKNSLR
nr:Spx/MgsR family RNA polymerase-binding regulatory protein [Mycoplasmoides alvi]